MDYSWCFCYCCCYYYYYFNNTEPFYLGMWRRLLRLFKNKKYIYLRCTTWCFDINIHSEMIAAVKLITISIFSHTCHFIFFQNLFFWQFFIVQYSIVNYTHHAVHYLYFTLSLLSQYFILWLEVCTFWPEFPVLLIKKVGCFSLNSLSFCSSLHCQHSPPHPSPSPLPFRETNEQWVPFQEVGTKWWNWSSPDDHTLL